MKGGGYIFVEMVQVVGIKGNIESIIEIWMALKQEEDFWKQEQKLIWSWPTHAMKGEVCVNENFQDGVDWLFQGQFSQLKNNSQRTCKHVEVDSLKVYLHWKINFFFSFILKTVYFWQCDVCYGNCWVMCNIINVSIGIIHLD